MWRKAASAARRIVLKGLDCCPNGSVVVAMETNAATIAKTQAIETLLAGLAHEIDAAMDAAISLNGQQRVGEIFQRCVAASALLTASRTLLSKSG